MRTRVNGSHVGLLFLSLLALIAGLGIGFGLLVVIMSLMGNA